MSDSKSVPSKPSYVKFSVGRYHYYVVDRPGIVKELRYETSHLLLLTRSEIAVNTRTNKILKCRGGIEDLIDQFTKT